MNDAYLHIALNHLPIIIPMVGLLVMIGGLITKSDIVKRAAFCLFILGTITAIPANVTGEGAEEIVEKLGISHDIIHEHEEKAETFVLVMYGLGLLSVIGLWANLKQKGFAGIVTLVVTVFSVVTLYFAQQTGNSGGEIRHTEIRKDFKPAKGGDDHHKNEKKGDKD
ncbi:hypothetical protein BKI52_40475 [marine bacterium AO1-C]|nr:hypothetical protein BKI52_40475 [marine bacterium AO1-C]